MKTLKFKPHLVEKILSGEKRSTWRLFDDKDLQVGDKIEFLNSETGEKFGEANILDIDIKAVDQLDEQDLIGTVHENQSIQEIIEHYRKLYGAAVDENTVVKMISFDFKPGI